MSLKNELKAARTPAASKPLTPRSWSLSIRLTAWYASSAFALLLVATGFLYWILVSTFDVEDGELLADEIHILRALLRDRPEDPLGVKQEIEGEWAARQYERIYIRLLNESRQPVVETPGMSKRLLPNVFPSPVAVDEKPGPGAEIHSQAGRPFWALTAWAAVGPSHDHSLVIQVAMDRTYEKKLLVTYRRRLWLVLSLAFVCCVFGGYRIARHGIQPVEEITKTARHVRSSTLNERIEVAGLPAELSALAATFNDMLDRLEESFQRLSQFSADIAHELRTPVNNLRGEAEVALSKPRSPQEYCEVLGSCLEECTRLTRMIDSLLFLSRAESPETQIVRERIDVGRELALVRDFYGAAATEAGVTLTLAAKEGIETEVDRTLFQRAVGNLVANALVHTPPGGVVTMTAMKAGPTVRVEVSDTGCGIPATHLPYLFDRFYRADRARSSISGGIGLGLAIVKSIATLH